ncbi:aspartate aminotransferase family protein [methanotrophic endosymbiont of Bathymodiolus puteoserpentis (Logatchev)]|jgi:ornithine--oxo-acid transaminase|uniref:aspartate aminotransferase family protein n=1 Tax=methanotrophic endosymbiont of Bathymodiolus puteoserpentis (Logatchev) TaxID=343235 RepID=UPI0013C6DE09|nr:aspartate aminotransferase family protein [methanotrophic endosymbiont of Bathymodiolus puteoserpentis (Logatchev)]SHE21685.1 Acetylornithine aminotransferase [methanotrophic endosymbiont of Bathymodiolus puteoserpentis (Logatchev)]
MAFSITELFTQHNQEKFELHEKHLNNQMVRVLQTIGYDRTYTKATGQYLYDQDNQEYLDCLSGFGVFAVGRNHPTVVSALQETLTLELPNLVQMDVSLLSGLLAKKILETTPDNLSKMFFCNSGTESVEAAIKFARYTTKREKIVYCDHSYHGLTMGSLSLVGEEVFREGFGPFLPGCSSVPFNNLEALESALSNEDVAAFIVEPIQGKGVNIPDDNYLPEVERLCKKYGTLFVADEVQTGIGRTGKFWAIDHWGVKPDMICMAKALSGGFVPVGGVAITSKIMDTVFNRMDRAVVHGSTFSKNNMAMAAGLATLQVMEEESLVENCAQVGTDIINSINAMAPKYEFLKEARGKGLMIAIEFQAPKSLKLKAAWAALEAANKGLFCQMVTIPLFKEHHLLTQVAGHGMNVVKLLPPLNLTNKDRDWIVNSFEHAIADTHKVPGSIWTLGKNLASHALKAKKEA